MRASVLVLLVTHTHGLLWSERETNDYPAYLPKPDGESSCEPFSVDGRASEQCGFTGTEEEAISKCAAMSGCYGIIEVFADASFWMAFGVVPRRRVWHNERVSAFYDVPPWGSGTSWYERPTSRASVDGWCRRSNASTAEEIVCCRACRWSRHRCWRRCRCAECITEQVRGWGPVPM